MNTLNKRRMEMKMQRLSNQPNSDTSRRDSFENLRQNGNNLTIRNEDRENDFFGNQEFENFMSYDSQEFSETIKPTPVKNKLPKPPGPQIWTPRPSDAHPSEHLQMRQIFDNYSPIHLTSETSNSMSMDQSVSYSQGGPHMPVDPGMEDFPFGQTQTIPTMQKPLRKKLDPPPLVESIFIISADKSAVQYDFNENR
jgi:hypothetical protein